MNNSARATAIANTLFNVGGALVFFPFLGPFAPAIVAWAGDPGIAVAWAHLLFDLTLGIVFLLTLDWVEPRLRRWLVRDSAGAASVPASS